jgi:chaperone required for assembly of F1-ATPase
LKTEGFQIHLDTRPIRTPSKSILTIPRSKPHLAAAIALEWDLLTSAQQALKQHLIPLTSLASRAQDLHEEDPKGQEKSRKDIADMVMRYLDTDTMLCWAPETSSTSHTAPGLEHQTQDSQGEKIESLRDVQIKTAMPVVSYLTTHVWPGVEIRPVTDSNSIVPVSQEQETKDVIRGWLMGLPAWELAGLERAVLAGKGLLGAVRLVVEWSPEWDHLRRDDIQERERFGIHEASEAASLEVRWQTDMWGEVEDTHDVEKEDLRRQLGSVIMLLSGSRQR